MKIKAFLKKDEGGCDFSTDFENEFVKNKTLHPKVKEVEIDCNWYENIPEPEVLLYDEKNEVIYKQKGNQVLASKLQEFILNKLQIKRN